MEPILVNATQLRVNASEILQRVKYKRERFLVQTFGKPTAMIISVDDYQELIGGVNTEGDANMPNGLPVENNEPKKPNL